MRFSTSESPGALTPFSTRWPPILCLLALSLTGCSEDPTSSPSIVSSAPATTIAVQPTTSTESTAHLPTADLPADPPATAVDNRRAVATGAQNLVASDFELLAGKRVGLIGNQTSATEEGHLADLLAGSDQLQLVALFAPEHGLRGDVLAGDTVLDDVDPATGLPIFSLYGSTRTPSAEMLDDLDVLVFDIQDVGARFYTFISTMGLAMQAAAAAEIDFVVLDRPNPLGGVNVAGFTTDPGLESFVSQYPIPSVYGLTSGELARAIKTEGWLPGLESLNLKVVEVTGWERDMLWPDGRTDWVSPSPALPTFTSALAYPGVVLFEATTLDYGRGTDLPFLKIVGEGFDGAALAQELNRRQLPGVRFDAEANGVRYKITDDETFEPVSAGVHVLEVFYNSAPASIIDRPEVFDLLAGSTQLREMLESGSTAREITEAWQADVDAFESIRRNYLLY